MKESRRQPRSTVPRVRCAREPGQRLKGAFKYLGSIITEDLTEDEDVDRRIAAAAAAFGRFSRTVFRNKGLSLAAKGRAFSAPVLSQLLYQSECWASLCKQGRNRPTTGENSLQSFSR